MRRLLALSLFLAACSGGEVTPLPDPPAGPALDEYLAAESAFGCLAYSCVFGIAPSEGAAFCGPDSALPDRRAGVAAGRLSYDRVRAGPCVEALRAYKPLDCWGPEADFGRDLDRILATCAGVLVPRVALGGACVRSEECADGYCAADAQCPGHCAQRLAAGATCGRQDMCANGLICLESRCFAPLPEGGACTTSSACAGLLWCRAGRCVPPLAEGQGCDPAASHCDARTYCAPLGGSAGGSCVARIAAGDRCSVGSADTLGVASPVCAGNQVCVGLRPNAQGGVDSLGHCALPADAGGACTPTVGASGPEQPDTGCFLGVRCDPGSNTCRSLPGPGEPCFDGACAQNAYCASGSCAPRQAAGAACTASAECVESCVNGQCGPARVSCHAG